MVIWILVAVIALQTAVLVVFLLRRRQPTRSLAEMTTAEVQPLIDLAPVGIAIVHDRDFSRVTTNATFDRIFGPALVDLMRPNAQLPIGITLLREGREVDGAELPMVGALRDGERVRGQEFEVRLPDQRTLTVFAAAAPVLDADGTLAGCIGSFVDITERKHAELDALEQRNRLAHLWRVATLGELSGQLAHEISQPLTAILANVQAAQRMLSMPRPELESVKEILQEIADADLHASEVIQRTRALMKHQPVAKQLLDLNHTVEHALELMHAELAARRVVVRVVLSRKLPHVLGDRVQLEQVLLNLMINACDAMSEVPIDERRLTVITQLTAADEVHLLVRDRGTGIPEDIIDAVFRPFVTSKDHGLGLGLSICQSIVADHGGQLWAFNNSDSGATFALALPRAHSAFRDLPAAPQRATSERAPAAPAS